MSDFNLGVHEVDIVPGIRHEESFVGGTHHPSVGCDLLTFSFILSSSLVLKMGLRIGGVTTNTRDPRRGILKGIKGSSVSF